METPKIKPYLALVVGVVSVSTSAIFVKLSSAPSGVIAFYRLFFSVMIMLPLVLLHYVSELRLITKQDWFFSGISGIFLAFHFILWFESLNFTSVASSTVLVTLQPLFAFIGAYFIYKERLSVWAILSGVTAVVGSVVISWGDFKISGNALTGDILAFIACAFITFNLLFGQSVRKRVSIITYTFIMYSISSVIVFFYIVMKGFPLLGYEVNEWRIFLLLAIIPTLMGHTLFNWSLKWISTSVISVAILFEPVGATILAYYILDEMVELTQLIGGLIVITSISLFLFTEKKENNV